MNHRVALTVTSLISIILFSLHWADEVSRGLEPGTMQALGGIALLAIWLSATLAFSDKRWGLFIVLLFALLATGVPILHMTGRGLVQGRYATNATMLFWVWTNIALGACGMVSLVLGVRVLWSARRNGAS